MSKLKPTMFEIANKLQRIIDEANADELEPCPSCGKDQNVVTRSDGAIVWCTICGVQMPINLWNRRLIEDALAAKDTRIAELKGALSRLLETHTFYTEHDKIAVDGIKDVLKGEPVNNKKDMAMPSPEHNALRNQADRLGWSYIRINAEGKLVGLPPPPANNQDLIEITAAVLERKTDGN